MRLSEHRITPVESASDLAEAALLFREYAASLPVDLAFQGFEAEVANLPGAYAPPAGTLLLAQDGRGPALGCVALRPLAGHPACAEMKRLYVSPSARGTGAGRRLIEAVIVQATRLGYADLYLDTLPGMAVAYGLYQRLGFLPVPPFYPTPVPGTRFLRLALTPA